MCCHQGVQLPQPLLTKAMGRAANLGFQGTCKTPITGGWGKPPHLGQAACIHPCHPTRSCCAWIESCAFPALRAGAEPGRDTQVPPFPRGAALPARVVWHLIDAPGLAGRFRPLLWG